jgi:thiamine pyrophosphokinase
VKALLVAAAFAEGAEALLARLAPNADLVVAVDGGADVCLSAGVTPDVVVGDLDSAAPHSIDLLLAKGVPVHRYPAEKDATDLELAIAEARRLGADEIFVTCATTGRLDHTLATLAALAAAADLDPTLVEPDLVGWLMTRSGRSTIDLAGVNSTISLIPWGGTALVSARGVRWPLSNADIGPETTLGVSNVITSSEGARLTLHQGAVFVLSVRGKHPPATKSA